MEHCLNVIDDSIPHSPFEQMGSRFVATQEASCHAKFKKVVTSATEGDTLLALKKVGPVRMIRNKFFTRVNELEDRGASKEELQTLLGR